MKALQFEGKGEIGYSEVPDPSILSSTDVIVKVLLTAVCGSDLHVYHEREKGLDCGTIMGHEFVGEVVEIGKDVKLLNKGDRVVSPFTTNCGNCYYCKIGLTCRCEHGQLYGWVEKGKGLHGCQAQYVRVPLAESSLMTVPKELALEEALLLGDVRTTGFYCADQANIQPERVYVVLGCGPVGLMSILGAKELGAQQIIALDSVAFRLAKAEELGAKAIHYQKSNPLEYIHAISEGRGADAVLEAVGSNSASRMAFDLVRPGGIISTVGVHTSNQFSFSPVEAYDKNITYKIGRSPARYYMEKILSNPASSYEHASKIVTHDMSLKKGKEAYSIFDQKKDNCIKVVLRP